MTTVGTLITQALKAAGVLGVGQTALAEDMNDALYQLNLMISEWRAGKQLGLLYQSVTKSVVSTGASSYTLGPTGDMVVDQRPTKILSAFVRQVSIPEPNTPDYPLGIIESQEDYNRIIVKEVTSFPSYLFYNATSPNGIIYPWPLPRAALYAIYVSFMAPLASFGALTDVIELPDGYESAMFYNLAKRLSSLYKIPMDARVDAQAKAALANLKNANTRIPNLIMPQALTRPGIYNPYSDRVR